MTNDTGQNCEFIHSSVCDGNVKKKKIKIEPRRISQWNRAAGRTDPEIPWRHFFVELLRWSVNKKILRFLFSIMWIRHSPVAHDRQSLSWFTIKTKRNKLDILQRKHLCKKKKKRGAAAEMSPAWCFCTALADTGCYFSDKFLWIPRSCSLFCSASCLPKYQRVWLFMLRKSSFNLRSTGAPSRRGKKKTLCQYTSTCFIEQEKVGL